MKYQMYAATACGAKKHPCPDCSFCQFCPEDRCRACLRDKAKKGGAKKPPAKAKKKKLR